MLVCRSAKDVSRGNDLPCVVVGSETRAGMGLPLNVARRLALDRALRREVENISIMSEDRAEYKPGSVQSREDLLEMTSENDSDERSHHDREQS